MWNLVLWPGIEPWPLHWECKVLANGPPGNSLKFCVFQFFGLTVQHMGSLVPWPGIQPVPSALEGQSLNHWIINASFLYFIYYQSIVEPQEKAMAPHSSTLAWKIPWTEEPGRLQSMGLRRVGHDWATSLSLFTFMHWRRKWQATPVFLPGESQGRGSLVDCRLWGHTESDTTEAT